MNTEQESIDELPSKDTSNEQGDEQPLEQPDEQFQPTIKELEENVWQATRGPGTKAVAWLILGGMAACLIGLVIIMIIAATQ